MNKKILVAEDDQAILEVIKIILGGEGYKIFSAEEKDDLLRIIEKDKPDLILLDIWLSGHDGGQIAKELKSKKDTKNIPLILISANNETANITKESGADGYLLKPFDIDNLLKIVKKHI